jgi:S-disulfanyl-L-cysteine oxidoreductase SoxD
MKRLLCICTIVAGCGFFVLIAQQTDPPPVYTTAQASAGKAAYESYCVNCHTKALTGRKGDPNELPPLNSLPAETQTAIKASNGRVPTLIGAAFLNKWATTKDLADRIEIAVGRPPARGFTNESYLDVAAYVLQANGAKPGTQPLTASTAIELRALNLH